MARKNKQLEFFGNGLVKPNDWFGGDLLFNSHAKTARPLESKMPLHVVLRSEIAKGPLSMRAPLNIRVVGDIVNAVAKKYGITIYKFANVGNHLHMLARIPGRRQWNGFSREITGRIARHMQRLAKKLGIKFASGFKFWAQRPFTRIVRGWKKAFKAVRDYVVLNQWEAAGFIKQEDRAIWKQFSTA